jgi:hypothetical protein
MKESKSFIRYISILLLITTCAFINNGFAQTGKNSVNLRKSIHLRLCNPENSRFYSGLIFDDSTITDVIGSTDECTLYLKNRSSLKDVSMIKLTGSSLFVVKKGISKKIDVQDINKIVFPGKSGFWTGAIIGTAISAAAWTLLVIAFHGEFSANTVTGVIIYSLPGGLLGGLIGLIFSSNDVVYDISGGNPNARMKRLKYIMQKHHSIPLM